MNEDIRQLEPKAIWKHFADLNAVPRPSKKEEKVIAFMRNFGESLDLETSVDGVGNVIIRKPATTGMDDRKRVVLQSHLDMVHQKNNDTAFDFDSQGIQMQVNGDWVTAKGTTLGADNGLGVATIMAILASDELAHPAIEALFTIDEETGMTGAMGLEPGILQGDVLLNLDTEEDDEIGVGCAGGIDLTASQSYEPEVLAPGLLGYTITVKGLQGGHSGMDIHKGLGNANKIMNRLLLEAHVQGELHIAGLSGGGLRNAIPRESHAVIAIAKENQEQFLDMMEGLSAGIITEFKSLEPNLSIEFDVTTTPVTAMPHGIQERLLKSLQAAHNGVYRMSPDIEGLVETSNNVAKVVVKDGGIEILCLARSSSDSSKNDVVRSLESVFELAGFTVVLSGEYPGWQPDMNSSILRVMEDNYKKLFNESPHVAACHAGLECGILGQNYPGMEMISFGPTIKGAHSPDEKVSISSVQKFWKLTLETLKDFPKV
ncbi:MAG: cytosol nonspecific dipeptidase [Cytophagaceae bacterium]|nr:cytosol nonspecific dipeptidase [Cytophagaceae bacterium]